MPIQLPTGPVERLNYRVDTKELDKYDVLFEVIPCTQSHIDYIEDSLKSSLKAQYRDDSRPLPLRVAMMDDIERDLVSNAIDAILGFDSSNPPSRGSQYECQVIVESWMEVQFRELTSFLPDSVWLRQLTFEGYIELLTRQDHPTALSTIIGAVPRFLSIEAAELLDIEDSQLPDASDYLLVRPFF